MNDKRPFIIFGVAALILLIFFMIFSRGKDRFNWQETYLEASKEPYGTFVIYNLLQNYFSGQNIQDITKSIKQELPDSLDQTANYIFVGEGLYMDSMDVQQLLRFVESGNNAFISSKSIPHDLMFYVYYEECNGYYWNDYVDTQSLAVTINLEHQLLTETQDFVYTYRGKNKSYRWQYIDSTYFCEEDYSFIPLGKINDQLVNFVKMDYGEGAFYLHTTPIAFSNIQLLEEQGVDYVNKVFSHLADGAIYWDTYSRVPEAISRRRNQRSSLAEEHSFSSKGPLSYILEQRSLAWAWYLLLAVGLLYLLFRAKRKQRIIPVYEGNKNTSLEFISTIGTLYFLQNDHKKLCEQKMRLFLSYVRERYNLPTKEIDDVFVNRLHAKSEVPQEHLQKIIQFFQNIKNSHFVSEQTMVDFHLAMDRFYKIRK